MAAALMEGVSWYRVREGERGGITRRRDRRMEHGWERARRGWTW